MKIEKKTVPSIKGDITIYRLTNAAGCSVELSSLGAGVLSVVVPDRAGNPADVALGYADINGYFYDDPFAGKIPGRYANRIAYGRFAIDGTTYQLTCNNGPHALHGGRESFANQIWESLAVDGGVEFRRVSPDGEEGYPGEMTVRAIYRWTDSNELHVELHATTDKKTIVNLTNHTYFNLDGEASGSVLDHELRLNASAYVPTDATLAPTGGLAPTDGTPMDFREAKPLGRDIKKPFPALDYGKGYDCSWAIDGWKAGELTLAAVLYSPKSGRLLEVETTQPAVHVYTGNWLSGCPTGKSGKPYADYDGVAMECQGMPDAPNHAEFPSQELSPGEEYFQKIIFKFKTK